MRGICSMVYCNFLLFAFNLFNFISRVLFNCVALVLFNSFAHNCTLICLIFVERDIMIFLTILLYPNLFILWGYTINIDSNIRNVIEMCSNMFWMRGTFLGSLWKISICSHMYWFMAFIFSISDLYISETSFVLFMVVSCDAAHAPSKIEVNNSLPHCSLFSDVINVFLWS